MDRTQNKTNEPAPEPHAPKTREEIVEENRHRVPISNSREKLMADSGAARDHETGRASELEELTGRGSDDRPSGNSRFIAYGLLAFGVLIMLVMIGIYAF